MVGFTHKVSVGEQYEHVILPNHVTVGDKRQYSYDNEDAYMREQGY